jgi:hypothetical protein
MGNGGGTPGGEDFQPLRLDRDQLVERWRDRQMQKLVLGFQASAARSDHQYGRTNPISTFRSKTYAFAYPCGSEFP